MLISIVEGSFEAKLPTIWTDGKAEDGKAEVGRDREEKRRRDSGGHDFFFVLLFVAMGTGNTPGFLGGRGEGHPTGALGAQWRCLDGIGAAMSRSKLGSSGLLAIGRQ